jgi:hypothetical protein
MLALIEYSQVAWACLGLLHHKAYEPWLDSARRCVLLDLVRGVEDWATDAALNAMVTAAWADPGIRSDVMEIAVIRFAGAIQAQRQRVVTIAEPLAHLMLITPGIPADVIDVAKMVIKRESATETPDAADAQPRRGRFRRRS